jgi:hypothetical protein
MQRSVPATTLPPPPSGTAGMHSARSATSISADATSAMPSGMQSGGDSTGLVDPYADLSDGGTAGGGRSKKGGLFAFFKKGG